MRTLLIDIETTPNLGYFWDIWNQNIGLSQVADASEVFCFAAKWRREKKIEFHAAWNDKADMIGRAWELLDESDAVVHYNGRRFDVPHLNREFLLAGYPPPSPYKQIDLYATVKKQFKFLSNKLAYVSEALGIGGKVPHEGFELWLKCMAGDRPAQKRMEKYNVQDVRLLEPAYDRLQVWVPGHPNVNLYNEEGTPDGCPGCGSTNYIKDGSTMTNAGRFPKYRCKDCHKHFRGSKREAGTSFQGIAS